MEITLSDLRHRMNNIMQRLQDEGYSEFNIDVDHYWSIPADELYDPYQEPRTLTIGQVTDDWNEVERVSNGERGIIPYHLVWLAEVIKAVGHSSPSNKGEKAVPSPLKKSD